ncbi:MAG: PKD domain-containing protein [Actinomycetes bacterium]
MRSSQRRTQRGETLIESLLSIAMLSAVVIGAFSGISTSLTASVLERNNARVSTVLRTAAEGLQADATPYVNCATPASYAVNVPRVSQDGLSVAIGKVEYRSDPSAATTTSTTVAPTTTTTVAPTTTTVAPTTTTTSTSTTVAGGPKASFTANPTPSAGSLTWVFDASASTPTTGAQAQRIASYAWKFGDGTGPIVAGVSQSYTYAAGGTFTVTLTVTDGLGRSNSASTTIRVNTKPTAAFTATPTTGTAPLAVTVNASASSDPDGSISTYAWSFGNGTSGSGVTATTNYAAAGSFTVTLTVTDNLGATNSTSQVVQVAPTPAPTTTTPPESWTVGFQSSCPVVAGANDFGLQRVRIDVSGSAGVIRSITVVKRRP